MPLAAGSLSLTVLLGLLFALTPLGTDPFLPAMPASAIALAALAAFAAERALRVRPASAQAARG